MALLQPSFNLTTSSSTSSSSSSSDRRFVATLSATKLTKLLHLSLPKIPNGKMDELNLPSVIIPTTNTQMQRTPAETESEDAVDGAIAKLYAIAEAVADRAEMHANIGEQRNNWNSLLVNSINAITLAAATMAGLSTITTGADSIMAVKITSTLLYSAATGLLLAVNKIQPSQLAEEQRNAARLFRHLYEQIHTTLALRTPTLMDVEDALEKVLVLDKAYPLPLLPGMLDKFPAAVEPARWWPSLRRRQQQPLLGQENTNGWNQELEKEMRGVLGVLKRKDTAEYVRLSKLVLKVNRILAVSGPLLTGIAALGTLMMGSASHGSWAALVGVAGGALANVVNTLEHGGEVGMVFEMYRSCAGFYRFLEESIESNLNERELGKRENGEVFEMSVALELGRSISELRDLVSSPSSTSEEFAGKLF